MLRRWLCAASKGALICAPLFLAGCAGTGQSPTAQANNDPYESFNREMWSLDLAIYHYALRPVASGYRDVVPDIMQEAIGNIFHNMKTPIFMANNLLQGDFSTFGDNFARLFLNTTLGLGGMIDIGSRAHLPYQEADLGQTFGSWGIDSGPYLVLPLLGPSDPRDLVGYGIESVGDPFAVEMRAHGYSYAPYIRSGVEIIHNQAQTIDQFDELERSSLDFYAAARSLYQQDRAGMVQSARGEGNKVPAPNVIDLTDEPGPTPSLTPSDSPTPSSAPEKAKQ